MGKNKKFDVEYIVGEYEKGRSFYAIAEELGTYAQHLRRMYIKQGGSPRGYAEAQKIALESGRVAHPTEGKIRSVETKEKISAKVADAWKALPEREKKRRQKVAKRNWNNTPKKKRKEIMGLAHKAIRRAATEGSKLEKFLCEALKNRGYVLEYHVERLIKNEKMQLDMFLPMYSLAIEIDGLSHVKPIWGQEQFEKVQRADAEKNGRLLDAGISVLRLRCTQKTLTDRIKRAALHILLDNLNYFQTIDKPELKILNVE